MKLQYEQSEYVECYKGLNKNRQKEHLSKVINVNIRALRQQKYKNCKLALNKGKIEALPKIILFIYVFYFMFISIINFYDEMLYSILFMTYMFITLRHFLVQTQFHLTLYLQDKGVM